MALYHYITIIQYILAVVKREMQSWWESGAMVIPSPYRFPIVLSLVPPEADHVLLAQHDLNQDPTLFAPGVEYFNDGCYVGVGSLIKETLAMVIAI